MGSSAFGGAISLSSLSTGGANRAQQELASWCSRREQPKLDVGVRSEFERFRVTTKREQQALVSRIRAEIAGASKYRTLHHRSAVRRYAKQRGFRWRRLAVPESREGSRRARLPSTGQPRRERR